MIRTAVLLRSIDSCSGTSSSSLIVQANNYACGLELCQTVADYTSCTLASQSTAADPGGDDGNTANDGGKQYAILKGIDEGECFDHIRGDFSGKSGAVYKLAGSEDSPGNGDAAGHSHLSHSGNHG